MKRRQQGILTGMPFMTNLTSRTFIDDTGRKLYVATPPTRIASLAPSVTEMLFALGADEQVVAVTDFCDYPPGAGRKPKLGSTKPNIETLVALKADLILVPRAFIDSTVIAKLDSLKIPTYILEAKTIEDILSHLHTIGRIVDRTPAATRLVAEMRNRIQAVKQRTALLSRPRVFYVLNSEPLMTVGPGSFIHQLLELAGGSNIGGITGQPYPRISIEDVLKQNPDVLIFPAGPSEGIPEQEQRQWQRWSTLNAVRDKRIYRIDSVLMDRPGPRIVDGLELLANYLHPSAWPPSSPAAQ